ncbi:MAG: 30S ribosomal protein S1, partial [Candidatus Hydrogenedentota bacterium]
VDPNERKIGLSIREYQLDSDRQAQANYGTSGDSTSVSIGDVVGGSVPKSLLAEGGDPTNAANEMLAELSPGAVVSEGQPSDADKA